MKENKSKRPEQITLLGVLGIIIGIILLVFPSLGLSIENNRYTLTKTEIIFSVIEVLMSITFIVASIGLLMGKNWGRRAYSYIIIISIILLSIITLSIFFSGNWVFQLLYLPFSIPFIIYFIFVIRYLNKPEIKEYFQS